MVDTADGVDEELSGGRIDGVEHGEGEVAGAMYVTVTIPAVAPAGRVTSPVPVWATGANVPKVSSAQD